MKVRNISGHQLLVPELGRTVDGGEVVDVPDDRAEGYLCQSATWADESTTTKREKA